MNFFELYNSNKETKFEKFKTFFKQNGISREESEFLFKEYAKDLAREVPREESEARTILIFAYEFLITIQLYKVFQNVSDDLRQLGLIGLVKAIDTFDLSKGYVFSTYANICIKNEIAHYTQMLNTQMRDAGGELESLDELHGDEENGWTYHDMIGEEDETISRFVNQSYYQNIYCYLPPLEQFIIFSCFGKYKKPMTQVAIAKLLGCSHENVRIRLQYILKKVKLIMSDVKDLSEEDKIKRKKYMRIRFSVMGQKEYLKFPENYCSTKIINAVL